MAVKAKEMANQMANQTVKQMAKANGKPRVSNADRISVAPIASQNGQYSLLNDGNFLIPVSARSPESVPAVANSYAAALEQDGAWCDASLADIAYSTAHRRSHHSFRTALVAKNKADLKLQLEELAEDENENWLIADRVQPNLCRPVTFVFSGQGPQWWAMGRMLLDESPVFRQTLHRCDQLIRQLGSWSLLEELSRCEETSRINDTTYAQPAIFALQIGLFEVWKSWGINPDLVIGHSVGEIAAAYAAGILSLEDAVKVIFHRARTMGVVKDAGTMLATSMTPAEASEYLLPWAGKVNLAAINGPMTVTLSGEADAIAEIESDLQSQDYFARTLQVNYAFHSHQMEPVQADLLDALADIQPQAARIPMISTVTGKPVKGEELSGDYWWRNVREPVNFHEALKSVMELDHSLFLEISAHPVLAGAIGECFVAGGKKAQVITTLRREEPELPLLMRSLGMLHSLHCPIDWSVLAPQGEFVKFPAYPWHKQSYWSESEGSKVSRLPCGGHPILGAKLPGSRLVFQGFIDTRAQPFRRRSQNSRACADARYRLCRDGISVGKGDLRRRELCAYRRRTAQSCFHA